MEVKKCIENRRSVRKFTDQMPDKECLENLVTLASYAPSWKNTQTVRYLALYNSELKKSIADHGVYGFTWNTNIINAAPALIVVITKDKRSGYEKDGSESTSKGSHWQSFDAGIATQTLCLAAHDMGLGTVILGVFDEEKIKEILSLKEDELISALVPIGYPAEEPNMPKRKSVEELLEIK